MKATVETTPYVAVVKYWGIKDEEKRIPYLSNLSFTLDETLKTRTTIEFSEKHGEDTAFLQGRQMKGKSMEEVLMHVNPLRKMANCSLKFKMVSENYFPTAGGLASSASGFAALTLASAKALNLNVDKKELSKIARLVSGSACRSLYGGFVEWQKGEKEDGSDCFAHQIFNESHWPELVSLAIIVSEEEKKFLSRIGMKRTVETSKLFMEHVKQNENALKEMKNAVARRDFQKFAELVMKESNALHAVCLDSYPPLLYLNEVSKAIIYRIHELNESNGSNIAAYTFDAGPNPHILTLEENAGKIEKEIQKIQGVKKILKCRVGSGPKFVESHLF